MRGGGIVEGVEILDEEMRAIIFVRRRGLRID